MAEPWEAYRKYVFVDHNGWQPLTIVIGETHIMVRYTTINFHSDRAAKEGTERYADELAKALYRLVEENR